MKQSIGIDPGKKGVICLNVNGTIFFDKVFLKKDNTVDVDRFEYFSQIETDIVVIEKPFIMPGNFNKGITTQLTDFGILYGIFATYFGEEKMRIVTPNQWRSKFKLKPGKTASITKAKELYPDVQLRFSKRCTTDNDNMAEALLLSHYGIHFAVK